jgi:hypothetical protein
LPGVAPERGRASCTTNCTDATDPTPGSAAPIGANPSLERAKSLGDANVDEQSERAALLTALTTEHFVLQTANNATYAEAASRSTLYIMVLSSSMVATGFVAGSTDVLVPFVATLLPTVFLLGLFTVVRLVETALESMQCLEGIARIPVLLPHSGSGGGAPFLPRERPLAGGRTAVAPPR